jgi:hypothetical protein
MRRASVSTRSSKAELGASLVATEPEVRTVEPAGVAAEDRRIPLLGARAGEVGLAPIAEDLPVGQQQAESSRVKGRVMAGTTARTLRCHA